MLEIFSTGTVKQLIECCNFAEILFQRSKKLMMSTVFNPFF